MKNAIGIDIGGTNLKGVLVTPDGNIIKGLSVQTPSKNFKETFFSVIKELLNGDIVGIGIGVAGILDRQTGVLLESPNIAELKNFPFLEVFSQEFSFPVIVENDANTYTYAEKWLGAGREFDNFVVITVGTGIGTIVTASVFPVSGPHEYPKIDGIRLFDLNQRLFFFRRLLTLLPLA